MVWLTAFGIVMLILFAIFGFGVAVCCVLKVLRY